MSSAGDRKKGAPSLSPSTTIVTAPHPTTTRHHHRHYRTPTSRVQHTTCAIFPHINQTFCCGKFSSESGPKGKILVTPPHTLLSGNVRIYTSVFSQFS